MAIVGLIPFVCAAIKKKRRSKTSASRYERYITGTAALGREREREHARFNGGGAYQSQSCRFAVHSSPADELHVSYDDSVAFRLPPKELSAGELFSADRYERLATGDAARGQEREHARFSNGAYQSQSCRFAVRPSMARELVAASYDDGSAGRPPPENLLLPPASRNDLLATGKGRGREHARFDNGGAYQSQSCRFAARLSPADRHGFPHDDGAASPPPEDLSGRLLLPASRNERGVSRSLRFSSMRVFAWVSGASER